jgi:hypothetical protein
MAVRAGGKTRRDTPRERRPAVWPWLLMPLIVLLVFYALFRVHQSAPPATGASPGTSATGAAGR